MYTFRFDDVSRNTDLNRLHGMVALLRSSPWKCRIIFAVSIAGHNMADAPGLEKERVFPSMFHVESDHRVFYKPDWIGVPEPFVFAWADKIAAHGIVHVDHRLLSKKAQELSILTSCSLLKTDLFVPPFHKWNAKTEKVCTEHGVTLMRANGWKHLKYHMVRPEFDTYYVHTHDLSNDEFAARIGKVLR